MLGEVIPSLRKRAAGQIGCSDVQIRARPCGVWWATTVLASVAPGPEGASSGASGVVVWASRSFCGFVCERGPARYPKGAEPWQTDARQLGQEIAIAGS